MLQSVLWLSAHVRAVCETSNGANQPVRIEKRRSRPWKRALDAFHYNSQS
jgi:hypothetical protein